MRVLVSNDDGFEAAGIRELVKALSAEAEVYVFVPDGQRSASGHGISIGVPITARKAEFPFAKKAWVLSGTPVDCVKLGLKILEQEGIEVDMVFSGINHGFNLGTDTLYSGTVAAALEGAMNGYPSVAVSNCSHEPRHLESCCLAAMEALRLGPKAIGAGKMININVPDVPPKKIKGTRITKLGIHEYDEWFMQDPGKGEDVFHYAGEPRHEQEMADNIDIKASLDGYISVTPLKFLLTDEDKWEEMKSQEFGFPGKK